MPSDAELMAEAIGLSRLGFPAPNPRVGAVVVADGEIVGRGFHEMAGMPHAEVVALGEAGERARGGELFVTLEPCDHHGRTPPCTDAILAAGVRRVVFANRDMNPEASGGEERLRAAGVAVDHAPSAEAADVNRVFEGRWRLGRPYVVAKAAVTLDGFIADEAGESKWISGEGARVRAHELRAEMGCVLVGAETSLRDNPSLMCRDAAGRVHLRAVLDPRRRLPDDLGLFVTDDALTLRFVGESAGEADVLVPILESGALDLRAVLDEIAGRGMIGVLVEGGGTTIGEFFRQGFVDEVELHVSPKALGGGTGWLRAPVGLAEAWRFSEMRCESLGDGLVIRAKVAR
ncbi:MAG: bifunctional diaminohydroxyphosphoribosylaminopyrimidine deaminase/5-amino-6-(5-phosphoribosylamino)uracil reductase RibD [Fimbriimonadales bacterium]